LQKLLGILIAIVLSVANVLSAGTASQFGTGNAILIALQLFFGGVAIIYLDEVLKKGHGLFYSSIPLFSATNIW
jgi:protein transport protein SEC61 subunit alpha